MPIGTGNISLLNDIGPEVGDTAPVSLSNCSSLAFPSVGSLPTGMRDFAGHTQVTIPSAPSGASVNNFPPGSGNFYLSWTQNSNNESGFRIERSVNSGTWTFVENVAANVTTTEDLIPVTSGTTYRFRVRAYNLAGNSSWAYSNTVTISIGPNAPSNAVAQSTGLVGNTGVVVQHSWTDNSSDETGFRIEGSVNGSAWTFKANASANQTSVYIEIQDQTSYQFRVRSYNASGNSLWIYSNFVDVDSGGFGGPGGIQ